MWFVRVKRSVGEQWPLSVDLPLVAALSQMFNAKDQANVTPLFDWLNLKTSFTKIYDIHVGLISRCQGMEGSSNMSATLFHEHSSHAL